MKWFILQLLIVPCMVVLPVTGKWKGRVSSSLLTYCFSVLSKGKLKPCSMTPLDGQCSIFCKRHLECPTGQHCCKTFCGNVCQAVIGRKISNMIPSAESLNHQ
uniref:WAP domain-containing protein n=1 Tax=Prolemur simus TaxID=1328070 RepID=A0A8C8YC45_PROSS